MPETQPKARPPGGLFRRLGLLLAFVTLAAGVYYVFGRGGLSLEALVRHREAIDAFVTGNRALAVLVYVILYVVVVALSVPGATFLTICGGLLLGFLVGTATTVIGATIGATVIFLVARTALGEPMLKRAGPRALRLAQGFRNDAFSYLLFLRLVPAFPFFLINLVPAFAGVRILPFMAATALGIIPATAVFTFAGTGLDSVIAAQKKAFDACVGAGTAECHMTLNPSDVLTPQLGGALIALGLLALMPVVVRRLRKPART